MAEVFLARQHGLGGFEKQVVLKRILPSLSSHTDFVQMFLNEARLAARLSHRNVVQIYEAGEIDGRYYIAMEYIDGSRPQLLYDRAAQTGEPTPPGIACRIVADLLAGLHYAHTRSDDRDSRSGIVHRDVSPQNVLVTRSGTVKVVDFGIAKATRTAAQHTQVGQVKGKIAYMSPEQAMGRPVDARSDVFACGILLWELCTAARLFSRPNDMAAILAITEEDVAPARSVRPALPEALDRVLSRALARKLPERYESAQQMQSELEALIRSQGWAGDQRTLERHMQALLGSNTPLFGAPATPDVGTAPTLAMPALEAPQSTPSRQRTPSGMRSMPPIGAAHPPPYSGALPAPAPSVDGPTPPGSRTGRRVLVVISAAVLVSACAIFAIEWSSHATTPTESMPDSNAAVLLVELSEPAMIELDGRRVRVDGHGELELTAGRQTNLVATTVRGRAPESSRTIELPPAKPGERIPLEIAFSR